MIDLLVIIVAFVFLFLLLTTFLSIIYGAPYVVTDKKTIEKIFSFVSMQKNYKVADLGSGDGRIVIAFAKKGIKVHGYEINPFLFCLSKYKVIKHGLSNKAFIHLKNYWNQNLSSYNVIVVYGMKHIMYKLENKLLKELKKGSFVISVAYKFPTWKCTKKKDNLFLYKK